ncbi:hypothetical protein TcG_04743 [Trypanosoma cruzi]|nr:hypothetical protein TcG_04743 [Trypanosoma cruzi]
MRQDSPSTSSRSGNLSADLSKFRFDSAAEFPPDFSVLRPLLERERDLLLDALLDLLLDALLDLLLDALLDLLLDALLDLLLDALLDFLLDALLDFLLDPSFFLPLDPFFTFSLELATSRSIAVLFDFLSSSPPSALQKIIINK